MAANPVDDLDESEFVALHGAGDELIPGCAFDFDVGAVAAKKHVGGGEGDALVAVEEAVVVAEGLHERGCFFFKGIVVAGLRTEDSGLNRAFVANTVLVRE